jgi:hypothetical protein
MLSPFCCFRPDPLVEACSTVPRRSRESVLRPVHRHQNGQRVERSEAVLYENRLRLDLGQNELLISDRISNIDSDSWFVSSDDLRLLEFSNSCLRSPCPVSDMTRDTEFNGMGKGEGRGEGE